MEYGEVTEVGCNMVRKFRCNMVCDKNWMEYGKKI
jgi:hypothetical protein